MDRIDYSLLLEIRGILDDIRWFLKIAGAIGIAISIYLLAYFLFKI
jgi:hypothetical protein